jgi:AAA15 family ATPase/GTPase
MLLTNLRLTNFRCFETIELTDLDRLAIFIGQNDAGKTVLLDAIELLVTNKGSESSDFRKVANEALADEVILQGVFRLEENDNLHEEYRAGEDKTEFRISKRFTRST